VTPDSRYVAFTMIHFVQYQGTWYWDSASIYGWDTQETRPRFLLSPVDRDWNPDWKSTDTLLPLTTINDLPIVSSSPIEVSWNGVDYGGAGVCTFDVQVREDPALPWTDWLLDTNQRSGYYPGLGGRNYQFRSRTRDCHRNTGPWTAAPYPESLVETAHPHSGIVNLPTYNMNNSGLIVSWDGRDSGGSGIADYDVQYNLNNSGWTDWIIGTTSPSGLFTQGMNGDTVQFRVRARDRALNLEPWSDEDVWQTTFYTWGAWGTITDNGGAPIVGAQVTMSPEGIDITSSDEEGGYGGYVEDISSSYAITVEKELYGSPPGVINPGFYDIEIDFVLPSTDDQIINGDFENLEPLLGWITEGSPRPAITDDLSHTGQYAAVLGQKGPHFGSIGIHDGYDPILIAGQDGEIHFSAGSRFHLHYSRLDVSGVWSAEFAFANNPEGDYHQMVLGPDGTLHFAWINSGSRVQYRQLRNNVWSDVDTLDFDAWFTDNRDIRMSVGNDGVVHVLWAEIVNSPLKLIYSQRSLDGSWSVQQPIFPLEGYHVYNPTLAVDNSGTAYVVYQKKIPLQGDDTVLFIERPPGGSWSWPMRLGSPDYVNQSPTFEVEPNGRLHVTWCTIDSGGTRRQVYRHRDNLGRWLVEQTLADRCYDVDSDLSASGELHLLWSTSSWIAHIYRQENGAWSTPVVLFDESFPDFTKGLALDEGGVPHVAWGGKENSIPRLNHIIYTTLMDRVAWSPDMNIDNDDKHSYQPKLVIDSGKSPHLFWYDMMTGDFHTHYIGPMLSGAVGNYSISQRLTLTPTLTNPSLSFFYQLGGMPDDGGSRLTVSVADGSITTTILSLSEAAGSDWEKGWANMTPWISKTITLTFNLAQVPDRPMAWAYIDDVSVGSTYPDLWVRGTHSAAPPGEVVDLSISYGNRGGAIAEGTRITVTLPSGLSFVSSNLSPTISGPNLVWDIGDVEAKSTSPMLVFRVRIDPSVPRRTSFALPVTIRAQGIELESANNSNQLTVLVDNLTYFPWLTKFSQ